MTREPTEHTDHHKWAQWLAVGDVTSMARSMGWSSLSPITLEHPAVLSAWGIEPQHLKGARVSLIGRRGSVCLMHLSGCDDRAHALSLIDHVSSMRAGAPLCWWWTDDQDITMWTHTPQRREVRLPQCPSPVQCQRWLATAWHNVVDAGAVDCHDAWCRHIEQVCAQASLTTTFFKSFVHAYDSLTLQMSHGPKDVATRQKMALTVLLRVLILYFLQARGALNRDERFLWRHVMFAVQQDESFEHKVIRPLCFGALNCPVNARTADVLALGAFPFLNGGLFEPTALERKWPRAQWSNAVWYDVLARAFEPYRFVLFEQDTGIDPEMLGQVFEGVMASPARRKTGTFYTPRPLVREMVHQALRTHFVGHGLSVVDLDLLFGGDISLISRGVQAHMRNALDSLTVLDPAVGTGAFLIEALHQIKHLHETLSGQPATFASMRQWIHQHLHGVDINGVAVQLCEVRLWLMLLSTVPDDVDCIDAMEPLPNLGHRIVQGDSLLGLTSRLQIKTARDAQVWCRGDEQLRVKIRALTALRQAYLRAHGQIKTALYRVINRRTRALMLHMFASRREQIEARRAPLLSRMQDRDLLGAPVYLSPNQRDALATLNAQLAQLNTLEEEVAQQDLHPLSFEYALYFPEVFARRGFDVVITNPPWVRANDQQREDRALFRALYESASGQLWPRAREQGVRTPYGVQVDLSALFVERAIGLLKPGGVCMALVPAKLLRSLHGSSLRKLITSHHLVSVEDMSERDEAFFDATTYPATLCVQRREQGTSQIRRRPAPISADVEVSVWKGASVDKFAMPRSSFLAMPWGLSPDHDALIHQLDVLGTWRTLRPRRGLMTGRNQVFVHHSTQMSPWMVEMSRPLVTGRDVRAFESATTKRVLWPYDDSGRVLDVLPTQQAHDYFAQHADVLTQRRDHRAALPLWQMFRVHEDMLRPKVVWRDIGEHLEASAVGEDVMVLNTAYYIAFDQMWQAWAMSVYLNHPLIRRAARAIAERARGGWRRHFAWVICLLPMPEPFAELLTLDGDTLNTNLWRRWAADHCVEDAAAQLTVWFDRIVASPPSGHVEVLL